MMESAFTEKEAYAEKFSPRAYLDTYYSGQTGLLVSDEYLEFVLTQLCRTFGAGGLKGERLIDIGTGPTIYQLLSSCEGFKEITATDYCDQNHQELEKWLKNQPGHFDWSPVVKYVCELEGNKDKYAEKEEKLRKAVKQILNCDVTKSNPLEPLTLPAFDCVLSALCLEGACKDLDSFRAALKNITSLLKVGGHLVLMGVLEEKYYIVGQHRFSCLFFDEGFVRNAASESGLILDDFQTCSRPITSTHSLSDYKGYFFFVAHKENK